MSREMTYPELLSKWSFESSRDREKFLNRMDSDYVSENGDLIESYSRNAIMCEDDIIANAEVLIRFLELETMGQIQ